MAVSPNTNFTSGQILTAAQQNNFPRGVMGYATGTAANQGVTTTNADVNGATITFTAVANRAYRFQFSAYCAKNVSAGSTTFSLTDGTCATQYMVFNFYMAVTGTGFSAVCNGLLYNLSAGTQTVKMRVSTDVTTAAVFMSATNPMTFIIEDVGPI